MLKGMKVERKVYLVCERASNGEYSVPTLLLATGSRGYFLIYPTFRIWLFLSNIPDRVLT